MKIPTHILTGVALFAAALSSSYAQTATTTPVGYRTETIKPGYNLLGVDLAEKVEAAGVLDAGTTGNTLVDNDVDFSALAGKDLLVKLMDGPNVGTLLQADQTGIHTLTAVAGGSLAAVGGKYEVRVSSTVSTLFGASNSAGLQSGTDETSADAVYVPDGSGGFAVVFYMNAADAGSLGLTAGWYNSGFQPAGDTSIPYSLSALIRKNSAGNKDIVFTGHVVTTPTKVTVKSGYNYVSRILPVGMTTTQSNLQTSLASGTDESTADAIYNPTVPGAYEVYLYMNAADAGSLGLPAGWYDSGFADASAKVLNSGFLIRRNQASSITATVPIPAGIDI